MAEKLPAERVGLIMARVDEVEGRANLAMRGLIAVQVATLRTLIEKGLTTVDDAVRQIEAVQSIAPDLFRDRTTKACIQWAVDLLRGVVPLHGSIADRIGQRR